MLLDERGIFEMQKNRKQYKGICRILAVILIFTAMPFGWIYADTGDDQVPPQWDISKISAKSKEENPQETEKSYTLFHTYAFGELIPLELEISQEVVPTNSEKLSEEELKKKILAQITIEDMEEPTEKWKVQNYTLDPIIENDVRKTSLTLYPGYVDNTGTVISQSLEKGKYYKVVIPQGLFEAANGQALGQLTLHIYTEPDFALEKRIYHLEDNNIKTTDLYNGERKFSILGVNFHHNIKNVQLFPYSGKATKNFTIGISDIERISSEKIDVHIRNDLRSSLTDEENTGDYEVAIVFDDAPLTVTDKVYETVISSVYDSDSGGIREDATFLHILSKGAPELKSKYPSSENGRPWYDEKGLSHDTEDGVTKGKYFIKAVFYDADGKLELGNLEDLKNCIVRVSGGTGNLVDTQWLSDILGEGEEKIKEYKDKYFFVKGNQETALYIPIKDLRAQTTYQVILPPDLVYYTDTYVGNDSMEWTFTTTSIPQVQEISLGTVPEDYDEDEPFYIKGDFFDTQGNVKVYFNEIEAEDVKVVSDTLLELYLPSGRDRLEPGTYDIIVENDKNHQRTVYGSLSVIQAGEFVPNEEYKVKDEGSQGEVRGFLKRSADTLFLSPSHIDEKELNIDLDEVMGKDVYIRKIQYEGDRRYKIGILKTASQWADITIYGLTLDDDAEDDEISLSVGRTEPIVAKTLKEKLRGKGILSEFIQISGENFKMDRARISIPLKYGSAKNVKILRYDEGTRSFYEQQGTVNLVDGKVEMLSPAKGIFVAVTQ